MKFNTTAIKSLLCFLFVLVFCTSSIKANQTFLALSENLNTPTDAERALIEEFYEGGSTQMRAGDLTPQETQHIKKLYTTQRISVDYIYHYATEHNLKDSEDFQEIQDHKIFDIGSQKIMLIKYKDEDPNDTKDLFGIVFRGTFGVYNTMTDLNIAKKTVDEGKNIIFHEGFWNAFEEIKAKLYEEFNIFSKNTIPKKVIYTGHSLGAALATVAVYEATSTQRFKDAKYDLITYGSPRVCNRECAEYINSNQNIDYKLRIANNQDFFTQIPGDPYYHVGVGIVYVSRKTKKFRAFKLGEDKHLKGLSNPKPISADNFKVVKVLNVGYNLAKAGLNIVKNKMTDGHDNNEEKNVILKIVDHFLYTIHRSDFNDMMKIYYNTVSQGPVTIAQNAKANKKLRKNKQN